MPLINERDAKQYLAREYRFIVQSASVAGETVGLSATVAKLLHRTVLRQWVDAYGSMIAAKNRASAASLFVKAYARSLCGALDAMTRHGLGYQLHPDNVIVAVRNGAVIELSLRERTAIREPGDKSRKEWRNNVLGPLFREHLGPLFRALSGQYRVQPAVFWENVAVYVHHYYKQWMEETDFEPHIDRSAEIADDYLYLTEYAPPELFGSGHANPLGVKGTVIPHPAKAGATLRIRRTCCLKFNTEGGAHCTVCPCLLEQERLALFREYAKRV